jgi:hypothetical protein
LAGALNALEREQAQKKKQQIKETKDQTQFLRSVYENTQKQNPHSVGLV